MNIPDPLRKHSSLVVPRDKAPRNRSQVEKLIPSISLSPSALGLKQSVMIFIVLLMIILGVSMISKAGKGGNVIGASRTRRQGTAQREINVMASALEMFKADHGRYPTTQEGLKALVLDPKADDIKWKKNYISMLRPDPWRIKYVYRCDDGKVSLLSCGPDKLPHTPDDVLPVSQGGKETSPASDEVILPTNAVPGAIGDEEDGVAVNLAPEAVPGAVSETPAAPAPAVEPASP